MLKYVIVGVLSLGMMSGAFCSSWAENAVYPEKVKAYAALYPDYFTPQPFQNATYTPTDQKRAAQLLVNSFHGNTDEAALAAVLRPQDRSPLKSRGEIEKLLANQQLSWQDYEAITKSLAKDPKQFKIFRDHVNQSRMRQELLSRVEGDPDFLRQVRSVEHQLILRNLLSESEKNTAMR